jgi:hypothetical protein
MGGTGSWWPSRRRLALQLWPWSTVKDNVALRILKSITLGDVFKLHPVIFYPVESLAIMSWPAQPDIDTYYLHTHAYTPSPSLHQTALPVSSYSSLAGALDLPPDSRARSYVCPTRLPTDIDALTSPLTSL